MVIGVEPKNIPSYNHVIEKVEDREKISEPRCNSEQSKDIMSGIGWLGGIFISEVHRTMKGNVRHNVTLEFERQHDSQERNKRKEATIWGRKIKEKDSDKHNFLVYGQHIEEFKPNMECEGQQVVHNHSHN